MYLDLHENKQFKLPACLSWQLKRVSTALQGPTVALPCNAPILPECGVGRVKWLFKAYLFIPVIQSQLYTIYIVSNFHVNN